MTPDPGALVTALRALKDAIADWDDKRSPRLSVVREDRVWSAARDCAALLSTSEATTREGAEPDAHHVLLYRKLERAVNALDPAAADDKLKEEWVAAKWNVFNAAIRLVRESHLSGTEDATPDPDARAALEAEWRERANNVRSSVAEAERRNALIAATAFKWTADTLEQCADDLAAYRRATRAKETRA